MSEPEITAPEPEKTPESGITLETLHTQINDLQLLVYNIAQHLTHLIESIENQILAALSESDDGE